MATLQNDNQQNGTSGHSTGASKLRQEPLKNSGSIDHLEYVDVTPIIGREYPIAKIKDILTAPNSDQQLRDLAITICERGVGKEFSDLGLLSQLNRRTPFAPETIENLITTTNTAYAVFFRAPQDDLTVEEQKHVTYMLGKLTGRPEDHGLHVHPLANSPNNLAMADGTRDSNM